MYNRDDNQQEKELLKKILEELHLAIFPCELNQKKPAGVEWQKRASGDPLQVEKWFDLRKFNYGILCGTEHQGKYLTVVDVDNKKGKRGTESWATLTRDIESYRLKTFSVRTPSGGFHHFFYTREQIGNRTDILEGIDTRGKGGYVVGAGSNIDGNPYVILNDLPIADMPEELELLLRNTMKVNRQTNIAPDEQEASHFTLSESDRATLLELLSKYGQQGGFKSYEDWLRLGGALKHEGFSVEDWQSLSWGNARGDCSKKWNSLPTSQLTMGSLVYWARKVEPSFGTHARVGKPVVAAETTETEEPVHDMARRVFDSTEECMDYFDQRYYKVILGSKSAVVERNGDISVSLKKSDFCDAYSNKAVVVTDGQGNSHLEAAAKYWFERTNENYRRVIFDPDPAYRSKPDEINLWNGFAVKPQENGKAESYLLFVKEAICSGSSDLYDFLMDVLAQMVQEPHRKLGVGIAIALRGRQGVGKNFFVENLGKLFGDAFILVDNVESITGRFNPCLMNKILVFGDEAIWGGDRINKDRLKSLITTEKLNIEKKFKDAFVAENYCRFIFATNSDWASPVEKGNRRWLVLDVSDIHIRDTTYFGKIKSDLDNGGYDDLLWTLLNRDYRNRDFQNSLPVTEAIIENLINGFSPFESWIFNMLMDGKVSRDYGAHSTPYVQFQMKVFDAPVSTEELYSSYCSYVGSGYKERKEGFGIKLKRVFPSVVNKKMAEDGDRPHCYVFPSLDQTRREFEGHFGVKIDWENL